MALPLRPSRSPDRGGGRRVRRPDVAASASRRPATSEPGARDGCHACGRSGDSGGRRGRAAGRLGRTRRRCGVVGVERRGRIACNRRPRRPGYGGRSGGSGRSGGCARGQRRRSRRDSRPAGWALARTADGGVARWRVARHGAAVRAGRLRRARRRMRPPTRRSHPVRRVRLRLPVQMRLRAGARHPALRCRARTGRSGRHTVRERESARRRFAPPAFPRSSR